MVTRTRSRSTSLELVASYKQRLGPNPTEFTNFKKVVVQTESMTDEITPGYFKLKNKGAILPLNSANKTTVMVTNAISSTWGYDVRFESNPKYGETRFDGLSVLGLLGRQSLSFSPDSFPRFSPHDMSVLYTDALAKAKTKGMDLLTFYAEFHKTVEMISGLAGRVLKRANDIVRLKKLHRVKDRRKFVSAFSDSWLEYRYGWRILAYDIEDIQDMISRLNEGLSVRLRGRGDDIRINSVVNSSGSGSSVNFVDTRSAHWSAGGTPFRHKYAITETHATKCRAGVMIESYLRSFATVDPLLTAYELVPYSFVLDWFFNINQWIAAVSPLLDEHLLFAYKRLDNIKTRTVRMGPDVQYSAGRETWVPVGTESILTYETVSWDRSPLEADLQQLKVGYTYNFDNFKAIDALSLLWGRLGAMRKFTSI